MEIDFNMASIRIFSALCLIAFLILSHRVLVEDIAHQKIPNLLIIRFLKIALGMYLFFLVFGLAAGDEFAVNYIKVGLLNAAIALPFGYAMWYFDIFSPGDAKYFSISALLIPLQAYTYQFVPVFPSLIVIINAYVLAFLLLFLYTLYLAARKIPESSEKGYFTAGYLKQAAKLAVRYAVNPLFLANLAGMLLCMASIMIAMRAANAGIQKFLNISSGHFTLLTVLVLYFTGVRLMSVIFKNKTAALFAYIISASVLAFLHFILQFNVVSMISETIAASFFVVVFIPIARSLIDIFTAALESDTVENVKMEVILTEETAAKMKTGWNVDVPAGVPLTDDQAQSIKDNVPNMEPVRLEKHITFGPFIFIGALFTIIFKHTIIHYF